MVSHRADSLCSPLRPLGPLSQPPNEPRFPEEIHSLVERSPPRLLVLTQTVPTHEQVVADGLVPRSPKVKKVLSELSLASCHISQAVENTLLSPKN